MLKFITKSICRSIKISTTNPIILTGKKHCLYALRHFVLLWVNFRLRKLWGVFGMDNNILGRGVINVKIFMGV